MSISMLVSPSQECVPCLPTVVKTRAGVEFNPNDNRWSYRDSVASVSLDFTCLRGAPNLVASLKMALVWYAENKSSHHLTNMFMRFEHFLRTTYARTGSLPLGVTFNDLLNYRASLAKNRTWYLGSLSGLLQKWNELSIPGVTDDAVALLKQLRIKGNQKGEAVLTMDPEHGSFTDIEVQALHTALDTAYQAGEIALDDCVLVLLFLALGQRAIQYAALKVCDVQPDKAKDGTPIYILRVPRAKQRGQMLRADFKHRVLIPQIGEKLVRHANEVREVFSKILTDPKQAPLFPAKESRKNEPRGFEHHRTARSLTQTLEQTLHRLGVISERTGQPLHITATRFRRTIGTRAAVEGHGELVIAELLDHNDTQNVGVYVEAVPQIVERIDRAMAMHLAPLAQAFAGVVISDESEATRAGDPSSRICDPRFDPTMKPIANCGQHGFCGYLAPIACYTCRRFEPWLDGPHEAVLDHLITERERLMAGSDARISSINDRTILAVAEVVRRCQELRKAN